VGQALSPANDEREARQFLPPTPAPQARNLFELFAPVRGLLTDEEIDRMFSRTPSASRPVDFE